MAVLARDEVTLASIVDLTYTRMYYLVQDSVLSPPNPPTTNPPTNAPGDPAWVTTEPGYTAGATTSLYTSRLNVFSDASFDWEPVQKSSSYEAAKQAYNAAVTATQAANGKNKIFRSTLPLSGLPQTAGIAVNDVWWRYSDSSLTGPITGQWAWDGNAWQPATIASQVIANLTVDKLVGAGAQFNIGVIETLVSDSGFFKNLVTQRLVVGDGDNLWTDRDFVAATGTPNAYTPWTRGGDATNGWTLYKAGTSSLSGAYFTNTETAATLDDQFYFSINIKSRTGAGLMSVRFQRKSALGVWSDWVNFPTGTLSTDTRTGIFSGTTPKLPAGYVAIRMGLYTESSIAASENFHIDKIILRRRVGSVMIAEGAVTASHFVGDIFVGNSFNGGTFTGSAFQTSATGARVILDAAGLRGLDSSSNVRFNISSATGDMSAVGATITGGTFTGGTFQTDGFAGKGIKIDLTGIKVYDNSTVNDLRVLIDGSGIKTYDIFGNTTMDFSGNNSVITGATFRTSTGAAIGVKIDSTGIKAYDSTVSTALNVKISSASLRWEDNSGEKASMHVDANNDLRLRAGALTMGSGLYLGATANLESENGGVVLKSSVTTPATPSGSISFNPGGSGYIGYWSIVPIELSTGVWRSAMRFFGVNSSGTTAGADMPQTALAANLYMHTNGIVYRSSSAKRYKNDIRDIVAAPKNLLNVPVRDWVDATLSDQDSKYVTRTPGVIAEEVLAAGLSEFVTREGDGTVQGVMYDRLWLLLIPIVREIIERLDRMENPSWNTPTTPSPTTPGTKPSSKG